MTNRYPDNWDQIRKKVYRRDNHTCQRCGAKNTEIHAHHVKPKSQGGSDNLSNLLTVCKSCHESIHGRKIGGRREKKFDKWEFIFGAFLFFFMSLAIPPLAVVGIPLSILCIAVLIHHGAKE